MRLISSSTRGKNPEDIGEMLISIEDLNKSSSGIYRINPASGGVHTRSTCADPIGWSSLSVAKANFRAATEKHGNLKPALPWWAGGGEALFCRKCGKELRTNFRICLSSVFRREVRVRISALEAEYGESRIKARSGVAPSPSVRRTQAASGRKDIR